MEQYIWDNTIFSEQEKLEHEIWDNTILYFMLFSRPIDQLATNNRQELNLIFSTSRVNKHFLMWLSPNIRCNNCFGSLQSMNKIWNQPAESLHCTRSHLLQWISPQKGYLTACTMKQMAKTGTCQPIYPLSPLYGHDLECIWVSPMTSRKLRPGHRQGKKYFL